MNAKPAITWLTTNSDSLVLNNTRVVLKAMADNSDIYTDPAPKLADIETAADNFSDGIAAKNLGGKADTIKKDNLRLVLVNLMRLLAAYVTVACGGKMENLILSGFPPQRTGRQPVGPMPQPQGLVVKHGSQRGVLAARVNPVFGASSYSWRLTPGTPGAAPVVEQDTASFHTFGPLTAGVNHTIDVNALGAAGQSDWSNPASLTAD